MIPALARMPAPLCRPGLFRGARCGRETGRSLTQFRKPATRRWAPLVAAMCCAAAAGAQTVGPAPAPAARPPNIVLILVDDLGPQLLPLYGGRVPVSLPHIDRMASEGVVFNNAYASPVCIVSRAMLLTGRYPVRNGIVGHAPQPEINEGVYLDPRYQPSLAQPLREAGYATLMAGKWHGKARDQSGRVFRAFGFDHWAFLRGFSVGELASTDVATEEGGVRLQAGEFPPAWLAGYVVDFIEANRERPFFVYYPMRLVHTPLIATPDRPAAATRTEQLLAMVEYVDKIVGRVLGALEKHGLRDNTVVMFASDNGSAEAEIQLDGRPAILHGKSMLTEAGIRVPMIVSGGPVVRRGPTDALTDFTDFLPTVAALAGVPLPAGFRTDGRSIADFLLGKAPDTPRGWIASAGAMEAFIPPAEGVFPAKGRVCGFTCNLSPQLGRGGSFWPARDVGVVVRDKRYKLWEHGSGFRGLFDLQEDPFELVNVYNSDDPAAAEARRRLLEARRTLPDGTVYVPASRLEKEYGLRHHWRLDGPVRPGSLDYADRVNGFDAAAGPATQIVLGRVGNAAAGDTLSAEKFDAFIRDKAPARTSFTMAGWFRLLLGSADADRNLLRLYRLKGATEAVMLQIAADDRGRLEARYWRAPDVPFRMNAPLGRAARFGAWTHMAMTFGPVQGTQGGLVAREAALYINGERVADSTGLLPVDGIASGHVIGRVPLEIGGPGVAMDDVAIWDQALEPDQVRALYAMTDACGYDAADMDRMFNPERRVGPDIGSLAEIRRAAAPPGTGVCAVQ